MAEYERLAIAGLPSIAIQPAGLSSHVALNESFENQPYIIRVQHNSNTNYSHTLIASLTSTVGFEREPNNPTFINFSNYLSISKSLHAVWLRIQLPPAKDGHGS
jgi:hypothetical protein